MRDSTPVGNPIRFESFIINKLSAGIGNRKFEHTSAVGEFGIEAYQFRCLDIGQKRVKFGHVAMLILLQNYE